MAQLDPRFKLPTMSEMNDLIRRRQMPHLDSKVFQMQTIRSTEANDRIAGFFYLLHNKPKAGFVWLTLLAIESPFQLRGYGTELLQGLCAELEKLGEYSSLFLEVYKRNSASVLFFKKRGFDGVIRETPETFILRRKVGAQTEPAGPTPTLVPPQ